MPQGLAEGEPDGSGASAWPDPDGVDPGAIASARYAPSYTAMTIAAAVNSGNVMPIVGSANTKSTSSASSGRFWKNST